MICFVTVISVKSDVTYERIVLINEYNKILDNATENALRAGYKNVNMEGKPEVSLDEIVNYFFGEVAVMLDGNKYLSDYYKESIQFLLYQDADGYYFYDFRNGWSEKYYFLEREATSHEKKVYELLKSVKEKYKVVLSVPSNDGEAFENTIGEYSLIAVYKNYDDFFTFSGAKIELLEKL